MTSRTDSDLFWDFRWSQNQKSQKSHFFKCFKTIPITPPTPKKVTKKQVRDFLLLFYTNVECTKPIFKPCASPTVTWSPFRPATQYYFDLNHPSTFILSAAAAAAFTTIISIAAAAAAARTGVIHFLPPFLLLIFS